MIKKILDRYFLEKIAEEVVRTIKMTMYIDIYFVRHKNKITFYCNYVEESKRLLQDRVLGTIENTDIIHILINITEYTKYISGLEDRINKILK